MGSVERECQFCGKPFNTWPSRVRVGSAKFCSRSCAQKVRVYAPLSYVAVYCPDHPRAVRGYVREHVLKVESAIGHYLPKDAVVHHVNEKRSDNRNENLVACQDNAYHKLLHARMRALIGCGHPDWRWCWHCRTWSPSSELITYKGGSSLHRHCRSEVNKVTNAIYKPRRRAQRESHISVL